MTAANMPSRPSSANSGGAWSPIGDVTTIMLWMRGNVTSSMWAGLQPGWTTADKTGSGDFSYTRLYYGLSLQLPLYAAAIGAVEKARRAAGMYYMKVDSPVISESADTAVDEATVKEKVMESFRLSGLTLSDPVVVKATAGEGCPVISTGARTVIPEKQLDGSGPENCQQKIGLALKCCNLFRFAM